MIQWLTHDSAIGVRPRFSLDNCWRHCIIGDYGKTNAKSLHDAYYYYRGTRLEAVRCGKWKLRITGKKNAIELYDLQADISEKNNAAGNNPDVVKRLRDKMQHFDKQLKANSRPAGKVES